MSNILKGTALRDFEDWYMEENYVKSTAEKELDELFKMSLNMFYYLLLPHQQYDTILEFFKEKFEHYVEIQLDQTSYPKFAFQVTEFVDFSDFRKVDDPNWALYRNEAEAKKAAITLIMDKYNKSAND